MRPLPPLLELLGVFLLWEASFLQASYAGDVDSNLRKVERDFSILDARLFWYNTYMGGQFPFPDTAFILPCPLRDAVGVKRYLLGDPYSIHEDNFAEYNRRLARLLQKKDRLIDSYRTVFSFRWDVQTSTSQEMLISEYCVDPFGEGDLYEYLSFYTDTKQVCLLRSNGPDRQRDLRFEDFRIVHDRVDYPGGLPDHFYDPTNGLLSPGDVVHVINSGEPIPDLTGIQNPSFLESVHTRRRLAVESGAVEDLREAIGDLPEKEEKHIP